ncbi:MAG TPA: EF-Tu/IF-2/RF-3 family GTPase [Microbacterium sp.]|nr:EF-Tu/IF-2/RF-3 family GTPase [Microbacterium sp.]
MGWFGRKRDPQDANEMLRQYNEAEASRLAGLTHGAVAAPVTVSAAFVSGELVVEDVFTITGRGQVVTGTVATGVVRVGDRIAVQRGGVDVGSSEITGIEMFRTKASEAAAGTMAGLLLRDALDLARGDVIRTSASA